MDQFRLLMKNKAFRPLLVGQGISAAGDWMATVAFMAIVHDLTGSAAAVGGILILRLAPGVVAAPVAGRLAHKLGVRRAMLWMDLVRIGMALAVPALLELWWLYLWAFLIEVAGLVFLPARDSAIGEIVDEERLPLANSLVLASSFGTIPIGAGIFALASAFAPGEGFGQAALFVIFAVDAATYGASYLFIRKIHGLKRGLADPERPDKKQPDDRDVSFRAAVGVPLVKAILPFLVALTIAFGSLFALGVSLVRNVLDASQAEFGVLIVLFGVGGGIGMALLQRRRKTWTFNDIRLGLALIGGGIFITVLAPSLYLAYVGAIVFGAAAAYALAAGMSTLQGRLQGRQRVLAFTAFHILMRAGLGVGALIAGGAADLFGRINVPVYGDVLPARYVLFAAGIIVLVTAPFVRDPEHKLQQQNEQA